MTRVKAAIVYLVQGANPFSFAQIQESLTALQKFFNKKYDYPILIFHEQLEEFEKETLLKIAPVTFIQLTDFLQLPSYARSKADDIQNWIKGLDGGRGGFSLGYRQMCRFFAYNLYFHEALLDYDYYWRFDDDSVLLSEVSYDPFQFMADNQLIYGYRSIEFENMKSVPGLKELWSTTLKFAKNEKLKTRYLKKLNADWRGRYTGRNIYNNFEVNNCDYWRNHDLYKKFFLNLDLSMGFYKYRWGDSNLRALTIGLFLQPKQVHVFKDIGYRHNDHYSLPDSDRVVYSKDPLV